MDPIFYALGMQLTPLLFVFAVDSQKHLQVSRWKFVLLTLAFSWPCAILAVLSLKDRHELELVAVFALTALGAFVAHTIFQALGKRPAMMEAPHLRELSTSILSSS